MRWKVWNQGDHVYEKEINEAGPTGSALVYCWTQKVSRRAIMLKIWQSTGLWNLVTKMKPVKTLKRTSKGGVQCVIKTMGGGKSPSLSMGGSLKAKKYWSWDYIWRHWKIGFGWSREIADLIKEKGGHSNIGSWSAFGDLVNLLKLATRSKRICEKILTLRW